MMRATSAGSLSNGMWPDTSVVSLFGKLGGAKHFTAWAREPVARARIPPESGLFAQRHLRKVNVHIRGVVEIVREDIKHRVGNQFGNLAIVEAGLSNRFHLSVAQAALLGHQLAHKLQGGCRLRRVGLSIPARFDLSMIQPNHLANGRMS